MPTLFSFFVCCGLAVVSGGCVRQKCDVRKDLSTDLDWKERKARIDYHENAGPEPKAPSGWEPTPVQPTPTPKTTLIPIPDPLFTTPRPQPVNKL